MAISNVDMSIKDLLYNPTRFAIRDIPTLISKGEFTHQQVASVLNEKVLNVITSTSPYKHSLPNVGTQSISENSNIIVVWGEKDAGKTLLIGSIVSIHGFSRIPRNRNFKDIVQSILNKQEQLRYNILTGLFGKKGLQEIPSSYDDYPIETLNTNYKPCLLGRSYPISFVEVNLGAGNVKETDWKYLEESLKASMGHTHLFCLNSSPDSHFSLQDSLERQVGYFNSVLADLEKKGLMDTACAVYVVVTKTDQMRAPKLYLDNAAQTLVTSSLSSFWQRIQNICYSKHIYNAQPIAYSIGDFALKDLAEINIEYTKRLFYGNILPKCYPRKIFIERWFDYKKWWIKWIVLPIVILFILWGCYKTYDALVEAPQSAVEPFNYEQYFRKELEVFHVALYDDVRVHYDRLYYDLLTEKSLRTISGDAVLQDNVAIKCDSLLTVAFAPILQQGITDFFRKVDWSRQTKKIADLESDIKRIYGNKYLSSSENIFFKARQDNLNDFRIVRNLIKKSKHCRNLGDVKFVKKNCDRWMSYPFTNDIQLKMDITNAFRNACESCTKQYCREVDEQLNRYYSEINCISEKDYPSDYDCELAVYNAKISLRQNVSPFVAEIDDFMKYTDYDDLESKLIDKKLQIIKIIGNITPPQKNEIDLY